MLNFTYQNQTKIIFGKGTAALVGQELETYGGKLLLHYGSGSIKRSGLYGTVVSSLQEHHIDFIELGGVQPNPRLSLVRQGIDLCRQEAVTMILAVGGGSVIDSAKAIAAGVPYTGDVWDFYQKKDHPQAALPVATILTIPAAGSESSTGSVITDEQSEQKLDCVSDLLRPVFSILDPTLFFTLPDHQVANGVCDMMSHIMERYFTETPHADLTDNLCEAALRVILRNAPIVLHERNNYDAWAELAFAGNLAHSGLLGLGREEDWASHNMEHEISAIYDIPHGAGLSILTPAWMRYIYRKHLPMFVQFAVNVMGIDGSIRNQEATALAGIERLTAFFREMGLPTTLQEVGIDGTHFERMAKDTVQHHDGGNSPVGGIEKLGWQDIIAIFELAR